MSETVTMPGQHPVDRVEDLQHLERYRIAGLLLMAWLLLTLPIYGAYESDRMEAAAAETLAQNAAQGRSLYAAHCQSCHGDEGRGGGSGSTLASIEFLSSVSNAQMRSLIGAGSPGTRMPAYDMAFGGPLTEQQLNRVVLFLRSLEVSAASVPCWRSGSLVPPLKELSQADRDEGVYVVACDEPETGNIASAIDPMRLYQAQCADCHGTDGEGSEIAGALRPLPPPFHEDLSALARITREGIEDTAMLGFGVAYDGPLNDAEIEALVHWLQGPEWHHAGLEQRYD